MALDLLMVTSIYPPQVGGPAIFTSRFSNWLDSQNISNRVITYSLVYSKQKLSITEVKLSSVRIYSFFKFVYKIIVKTNRKSLILANGAFIETYLASLLTRREYIVKIPGDPVWEFSRNRKWTNSSREDFQAEKLNFRQSLLRFLFNKAFRNAKYVICPSQELVKFISTWKVSNERIKLIYNCVNPINFANANSGEKKYNLVTVSRLVNGKGIKEVIECAGELGLKLAVVGDGPLMTDLKSLAATYKTEIVFLGDIENKDVPQVLNESELFILNSESEATSYAIIEAKMCGLPVLARMNSGSLTIVRHTIDGLIYSSEPGDKLIDSLRKVKSNSNLITEFGNNGRDDALVRFNEEKNFAAILSLCTN
jgi:glycosyltransferase involved in cell wall biosynthesis